jgi:L-fuculose-phosphate aldolase
MSNANDQKRQVAVTCQRLSQKGFVANHDGNVTLKLPDGRFLATPTSFSKFDVTEDDLLVLDSSGKVLEGKHKVFSEVSWHLAIYRIRPDISCVVHAHPPTASGFGLAGQEIGVPGLPEAIVSLGRHILTTGFLSPLDKAASLAGGLFDLEFSRALGESDACVVPGNGVWAVGDDPLQAYLRVELVEQIARQHLVAHQLGGVRRLSSELVAELLKKRPTRGPVKTGNTPAMAGTSPGVSPLPSIAHPNQGGRGLTQPCPSTAALPDLDQLKQVVRSELSHLLNS